MPLAAGSRLGAFEVLSSLGAGGMGEVYRARDTELGRDVALKILSPTVSDADGLARFEREARILASLNHRNIAAIYGVTGDHSTRALVLELIEGQTLADLIGCGPLPIEQALKIADQIAEALDAAHERSIVHRDLKPANVKVTDTGIVKVLDFGIAKALAADSDAFTIESHHTRTGVVIGTRAYMSPEQTRGLSVDKRADVWAFGCVLYEMLTGRRAFAGASPADVTTAVLEREPDWTALPPATPEPIRRLLRRTLEKDSRRRLRDVADARIDLDEATSPSARMSSAASVAPATRDWRVYVAAGAAAVVVLAIGVVGRIGPWSSSKEPPITHVAVPLPAMTVAQTTVVAMSPSGRKLAVAGASGILIRDLDDPQPRLLKGTDAATTPFFATDGTWIGFHANGRLRKVALDGSEPITIADVGGWQRGFSAMDDGGVVAGHTNGSLIRIPTGGVAPQSMTTLDVPGGETSHRWPHVIPGQQVVLYAAGPSVTANDWNTARIVAQSLATGERRVIAQRGSAPAYAAGFVFYIAGRSLLAQRFDPARLEVSGPVITVLTDAMRVGNGAGWYAAADDGSFAVVRRPPPSPRKLMWFDRQGGSRPLPLPPAFYGWPRLSPDGTRVAVSVSDPDTDVWVYDVTRGTGTRITTDGKSLWPMWTRDGASVVFSSMRGGPALLRSRRANGTGDDALLLENALINRAGDWTPGGELILLQVRSDADLYVLRPGSEPRLYYGARGDRGEPRLSPDGTWVAYRSTETGRGEIFVSRFPDANGERIQVSRTGALAPQWSHDGRELFFNNGPEVWSARLMAGGTFAEPVRLFASPFLTNDPIEVAADGRFLMVVDDQPAPVPTELQLTFNIGAYVRRRAGSQ